MYVCMYVSIYLYLYLYLYMNRGICLYVYIYMYTYTVYTYAESPQISKPRFGKPESGTACEPPSPSFDAELTASVVTLVAARPDSQCGWRPTSVGQLWTSGFRVEAVDPQHGL